MTNKILTFLYFSVSLLFLLGIILTFYDYSYLGYYSDKIINWTWLGLTTIIIFKFWNKKFMKIYFFSLTSIVILSVVPMAIPFFGILHYFSTINDYQQIQISPEYRIERTKQSALSMQRIYVFEKKGIFEKNICRPSYSQIVEKTLNIDNYETLVDKDKISIQNSKLVEINKDSIEIEYQILGKKKTFFHKIKNDYGY